MNLGVKRRVRVTRYQRTDRCRSCGFCSLEAVCPSPESCIGCGLCFVACPYEAVEPVEAYVDRWVEILVDGERVEVPEGVTLKRALEELGWRFSRHPSEEGWPLPCGTGGCYACAVLVDGKLQPACYTPVRSGMDVRTNVEEVPPLRRISGYQPHPVGGVGTPWEVKAGRLGYIEAACFAHGCNLRCPQCQNYGVTYGTAEPPTTPQRAARRLTRVARAFGVRRLAISGGEPTLNRRWLIAFFRELRRLNPDAHLHLDTNATYLTPDYIDELVEAGVTDVGPDLKGCSVETFMRITGIRDRRLAQLYLRTAWESVRYMVDRYYPDRLFVGVGIPYNPRLISLEEVREMGERLAELDADLQVTLLDYRPEFRARYLRWPSFTDMMKAREQLLAAGLRKVVVQTRQGQVGPNGRIR